MTTRTVDNLEEISIVSYLCPESSLNYKMSSYFGLANFQLAKISCVCDPPIKVLGLKGLICT